MISDDEAREYTDRAAYQDRTCTSAVLWVAVTCAVLWGGAAATAAMMAPL